MAHTKAGGTTKTNRDSVSKRLGVKRFGGEMVTSGNIIIRQKGTHFNDGEGTKRGNDFTIYAVTEGQVEFTRRKGRQIVKVHG
ncbi:MAG: 50S ribosomal protein L27 [Candidatus Daviesbacteria bacterium GW2011_GWA1_41_61]|uniref:Large ribosomal subunit protein bL27 n=1 Tax=Candidatus Daviesbacteria bacterium GW2011_GWA2_40_9 TaxID=1618424 RepID=A0A0G0U1I5_9BACT|nr:MAG: 50S ribosomal protein L27 [Candidatus Daviesbacteria bacterium GW2011_GWC1_40_9]KKR82969.1 MAG: 50S ribosomal protein L27 [Candidatus Daviesbacteria bacterium GW2011_GWA2_40_9]KKR92896.1 MAG: 50S ribosomal protein L27 [Candidatus Daviesbacteria bacterium GW2011_GWB1_41_15]KKS15440.1 MAG: 50S ribosomal protein L27 [Candidatus Daviesbacteria bacterium GW2011_GWA1_41_61]